MWPAPHQPNDLYVSVQAKWAARVRLPGLGASVKYGRAPSELPLSLTDTHDANYLRTWHWFYRWVMASRTSRQLQRLQWNFARIRLRALRDTPWVDVKDTRHFRRIGDVFSSERAMAALLRAHVNEPGFVVTRGRAADRLLNGCARRGSRGPEPAGWTSGQMNMLHQRLESELKTINDPIHDTLDAATGFVDGTHGGLSAGRGTFDFDETGVEHLR